MPASIAPRSPRAWAELTKAREAFRQASMDAKERAARLEWLSFQLSELDAVQPRPGEDDELLASKARLVHAERLQRLAREGYDLLVDQDGSAQALLAAVGKRVDELAQIDAAVRAVRRRTPGGHRLHRRPRPGAVDAGESVEDAAERLAQVEDRLALLERVKRRHGPSLDAVLAWWEGARVELENLQQQRDPQALEAAVARRRGGVPRRRRARCPRPAGGAARFRESCRSGWRRWRWSTPGSRCGSAPS